MAEGRRLRPALARRDRDAALQDHHRPNAPRPDSARTKGRGQGRLQGAQPHDRSRHARLSKARLKPPGGPPLPPRSQVVHQRHGREEPASAFMRSGVDSVRPAQAVESVLERLQDPKSAALYVTDADGAIVGLLTREALAEVILIRSVKPDWRFDRRA